MLHLLELPDGAPGTAFCDDVDAAGQTVARHSCGDQVKAALALAYRELAASLGPKPSGWTWGRAHVARLSSPIAPVAAGAPPIARPGGLFTVDVGNPSVTERGLQFSFNHGASIRHVSVMDPRFPRMRVQLPGAERDAGAATTTTPVVDLLALWSRNAYVDLSIGDRGIGVVTQVQVFRGGP
jgi:acyl-homoserine lactone acylase PvdQ